MEIVGNRSAYECMNCGDRVECRDAPTKKRAVRISLSGGFLILCTPCYAAFHNLVIRAKPHPKAGAVTVKPGNTRGIMRGGKEVLLPYEEYV